MVSLEAQREFFNGLSSPVKRMHVFPAAFHAIFHEKERAQVVERAREFIRGALRRDRRSLPSLLNADKFGHTWEEYERLKLRGGPQFAVVRAAMKTGGRLSKGIDLGWRSGFDSGLTLDYVYENKAQGATRLGRLIDHGYLNSIGWRGIRQRKKNLEKLLRGVIEKTHAAGPAGAHRRYCRRRGPVCFGDDASIAGDSDDGAPARLQTGKRRRRRAARPSSSTWRT